MKKTIYLLFITLLCASFQTHAQTVSFDYDNDGNMIVRKVVGPSGVKASHKDTAAVTDEIGNQKITIYPNPTKGRFQVAVNVLDNKQKNYYLLYSLSGARLQEKNITNENTYIDISSYPAGAYLLDVFLGSKVSRWKMIKQ
jgi:hypothetical protein